MGAAKGSIHLEVLSPNVQRWQRRRGKSAGNAQGAVSEAGLIPAATVIPLRQGPTGMEVLLLKRNYGASSGTCGSFPAVGLTRLTLERSYAMVLMSRSRQLGSRPSTGRLRRPGSTLIPLNWFPSHSGSPARCHKAVFTWFFLTEVSGSGEAVVVDQIEIHQSEWLAPATAMTAYAEQMDMGLHVCKPVVAQGPDRRASGHYWRSDTRTGTVCHPHPYAGQCDDGAMAR